MSACLALQLAPGDRAVAVGIEPDGVLEIAQGDVPLPAQRPAIGVQRQVAVARLCAPGPIPRRAGGAKRKAFIAGKRRRAASCSLSKRLSSSHCSTGAAAFASFAAARGFEHDQRVARLALLLPVLQRRPRARARASPLRSSRKRASSPMCNRSPRSAAAAKRSASACVCACAARQLQPLLGDRAGAAAACRSAPSPAAAQRTSFARPCSSRKSAYAASRKLSVTPSFERGGGNGARRAARRRGATPFPRAASGSTTESRRTRSAAARERHSTARRRRASCRSSPPRRRDSRSRSARSRSPRSSAHSRAAARVVGLHHEDRGSPGARVHVTRVALQRALEVLHAAREVVAVLPQQAARERGSRPARRRRATAAAPLRRSRRSAGRLPPSPDRNSAAASRAAVPASVGEAAERGAELPHSGHRRVAAGASAAARAPPIRPRACRGCPCRGGGKQQSDSKTAHRFLHNPYKTIGYHTRQRRVTYCL